MTLYSWNFIDKKERSKTWYLLALSVVIWLVIWGFITKQYWMSFVIILVAWIFFFVENNAEDQVSVEVTELWMKIAWNFYDFSKIASYSFIYDSEKAIFLRLYMNKKWIKVIDLDVDNEITLELKNILPQYITENNKEDLTFSDKLIRFLNL